MGLGSIDHFDLHIYANREGIALLLNLPQQEGFEGRGGSLLLFVLVDASDEPALVQSGWMLDMLRGRFVASDKMLAKVEFGKV